MELHGIWADILWWMRGVRIFRSGGGGGATDCSCDWCLGREWF